MEYSKDVTVGTVDKRPESPDTGAYSGGTQALKVSIGLGVVVVSAVCIIIFGRKRANKKQ